MSLQLHVDASPAAVAHALLRRTGLAADRRGANRYVVDLRIAPERLQVAKTEHALVRRGAIPAIKGKRGCVRLTIAEDGSGALMRADDVLVLCGVRMPLGAEQLDTIRRALVELAREARRGMAA